MNVIKVKVNFSQRTIVRQGIDLTEGDYNSTKIVFDFDTNEGTKIFQMKNPSDEIVLEKEIINNEVILTGEADVTTIHNEKTYVKYLDSSSNVYWYNSDDEELYDSSWNLDTTTSLDTLTKQTENASIFTEIGSYIYEISLYNGDSRLTSASDKIKVKKKQIGDDSETAVIYKPVFDELLGEVAEALEQTDNLDIDVSKSGTVTTVTITKKDGTPDSVNINDGAKGDKGDTGQAGADAKINGVNTISIEAGTNITLDQEGNTLTINSTASGGTTDYSDLTNKPSINNVTLSGNKSLSDLGIQPAGNYVTNTDYATSSVGGVVIVKNGDHGITVDEGVLKGTVRTYAQYNDMSSKGLVAKGTLENVITGKGLIDNTYHDSTKQDITDNTLTTTNKTIPTAINEVNSIAKGANQAVGYNNYSAMITAINAMDDDEYNVGQNVYIVTVNVPDLWVSNIESTSSTYTYVDDATVINDLGTNGYIQVGYYKLSMLETQKVDLTNYVTNTDYAQTDIGGVIKLNTAYSTQISSAGIMRSVTKTYATYSSGSNDMFISKGTLENVFNGKGLLPIVTLTQAEYDALATKDPDTYYYIEES